MINLEFFKKQIETMDVKSDEFFDLYCLVCDKYYKFPEPDDFQQAAMTLRMYIDKAVNVHEAQLIAFVKILTQLFLMEQNKTKACMGTVAFEKKEYHFSITTDEKHLKEMEKMLGQVLNGNFEINKI